MNELMIKTTLGKVIREKRKLAGLSQDELATKSFVSRNYISLVERGDKQLTIGKVFAIANALGDFPSSIIQEVELRMKENGLK